MLPRKVIITNNAVAALVLSNWMIKTQTNFNYKFNIMNEHVFAVPIDFSIDSIPTADVYKRLLKIVTEGVIE